MRVGVIGAGNMGLALLTGFTRARLQTRHQFMASDPDEAKLKRCAELGVRVSSDNQEVARWADVVFVAVKPHVVESVLRSLGDQLKGKLVISIAAGVPLAKLEALTPARVIRLMPNLCAEVGEMAGCYCLGNRASAADERIVKELLEPLGLVLRVEESLMDAVTAVSGSGPAFFCHLIQAASEAGTELGLEPDTAKQLAAQTAKGAASMILAGHDPGELIKRVCTPGGTTAEGMKVLEERKTAESLKEAIRSAARRAKELSR